MSHNHEHGGNSHSHEDAPEIDALTLILQQAQSGLRSDVQALVEVLDDAEIFIPLAEDMPGVEENQDIPMDDELTFRPHMLLDSEHRAFAVAYSDPELVEAVAEALEWTTSEGALKFIRVPLRVAFDLAQQHVEGRDVEGLAFNPSTDFELVLRRDEAASIAGGQALPLVGYVEDLPEGEDPNTQVIEGADPPPAELLAALDAAQERIKDFTGYRVETTFNPERDREPHLTITLYVARPDVDRAELAEDIMSEASPHLPEPGYADLVFKDAPN